jgi:hypothetical protein
MSNYTDTNVRDSARKFKFDACNFHHGFDYGKGKYNKNCHNCITHRRTFVIDDIIYYAEQYRDYIEYTCYNFDDSERHKAKLAELIQIELDILFNTHSREHSR